jgi:hypothetical protein
VLAGLGWHALLARFAFELVAILCADHVALVRQLPDDGFYYLEIANRLARGQGFTFDGVHSTNGFHPLWQLALVPLASVFHGDALIRAELVVGLACSLVAVLLVVRVVRRAFGLGAALLGAIVAVQFGLGSWLNGMESPAVLLASALLLTTLTAGDRAGKDDESRRWRFVGLASALLVLARLDFAVVIAVVPIAGWWRAHSKRLIGAWCAGFATIAVPFGAWWLARWHHVLTTSATVKNATVSQTIGDRFGGYLTAGYARFLADRAGEYLKAVEPWSYIARLPYAHPGAGSALASLAGFTFGALAVVGAFVALHRSQAARAAGRSRLGTAVWAVVVVGALLLFKAVLDLVVAPLWASLWYSAPQTLAAGFGVGALAWVGVEWLRAHARSVVSGAAVFVAVAAIALVAVPVNATAWRHVGTVSRASGSWQDQLDLAAGWIHRHGPPGRYGAMDAGLLGYELDRDRSVVDLDGLVNDYSFAALVTAHASERTLLSVSGVDFLVNRFTPDGLQQLGCATVLWTSPGAVTYGDAFVKLATGHVYVVDVRSCPSE